MKMKKIKALFGLQIAVSELKKMKTTFIIGNLVLLSAAVALSFCKQFDFRYFTGLIIGNILSVSYFLTLGLGAGITISKKQEKASANANLTYGARYVGLFAVCAVLLQLNAVNIFFLIIPLFFQNVHYRLFAFFNLGKNNENTPSFESYTEYIPENSSEF